ncbi:alpha/beta hydrolase [Aquimarina sp. 2201CG5-10]|uniref:alpha/beta fold hydrolase n=1 Tax=Aquimarina callyspongiae TaxID=3098150 RepID=UPI002AB59BC9|nr:alpha/beta hydrolase [Aquimarina sp. 2201CG5-10]MDY8135623.1 alpha/beta hydrolase [Aquimarina sp. 2201CG5-10]
MNSIINSCQIKFSQNPQLLDSNKITIVFLHDSLGCIELWRDFPEKIKSATGYNVLSYDRQGYGQSAPFEVKTRKLDYLKNEAIVLAKIIDQLDLKNIVLFGHSDGGSIALLTAALFPDKIKGIITEGAHVFVEEETLSGIRQAVEAYQNTNLKEKLSKYHGVKTDEVFRMWAETWLSADFKNWNIEEYLSKITCPSLIIQGEKDEYGTIAQVHSIVGNTGGISTPMLIPNVGHTPHKEVPDLIVNKTNDFLLSL